jgi:DNA primase
MSSDLRFTSSEVSAYYAARVPKLKRIGRKYRAPCPVHQGKAPNFSVNAETGFAQCHSQCGRGWGIIGLEMALT